MQGGPSTGAPNSAPKHAANAHGWRAQQASYLATVHEEVGQASYLAPVHEEVGQVGGHDGWGHHGQAAHGDGSVLDERARQAAVQRQDARHALGGALRGHARVRACDCACACI